MRVSAACALRVLVASTCARFRRARRALAPRPAVLAARLGASVGSRERLAPASLRTHRGNAFEVHLRERRARRGSGRRRRARARARRGARCPGDHGRHTPGKAFEETEVDRAKAQILRFLNYKPRTRAELMTKLVEDKLYDPEHAAAAIAYLQDKGVHSDVDYSEQWARYKWRTAKWAPWRIQTRCARRASPPPTRRRACGASSRSSATWTSFLRHVAMTPRPHLTHPSRSPARRKIRARNCSARLGNAGRCRTGWTRQTPAETWRVARAPRPRGRDVAARRGRAGARGPGEGVGGGG